MRLPKEILRFSDSILLKDFANLLVHEGEGKYVRNIYPEDGYEEGENEELTSEEYVYAREIMEAMK